MRLMHLACPEWVVLNGFSFMGCPRGSAGPNIRKLTESPQCRLQAENAPYICSDTFKPLSTMVSNLAIQNFSRILGWKGSVLSMKIMSTSFSIEV